VEEREIRKEINPKFGMAQKQLAIAIVPAPAKSVWRNANWIAGPLGE